MQVTGEQYYAARPDPITPFSAPVAAHMNDDHEDATRAIVKHVAGITVSKAEILTLDRLGMVIKCERDRDMFKARIPFLRCSFHFNNCTKFHCQHPSGVTKSFLVRASSSVQLHEEEKTNDQI